MFSLRAARLVAFALFAAFALSACASDFDPGDLAEKLDFFHLNDKKKLPGERKEMFPGGVPGVSQGIPPDLVKGYQAPQTPPETQEAQTPPEQQEAQTPPEPEKPKPKPHVARQAPAKKPAQAKVTPKPQTQQQQQAQQQQIWPDPKPQQAQPQQQQTGTQAPWPSPQQQQPSAWPDAPAPNTFQR